ncbi:MAG: hypothetical protein IT427_01920 [Pirellulales bacterium]|nr:hypothetical protein [Pirellulales bacterium]
MPRQNEILNHTQVAPIGNCKIPISTVEDMILLKWVFHRALDLQDNRDILWVQEGKFDSDYLRAWSLKTHDEAARHELELQFNE